MGVSIIVPVPNPNAYVKGIRYNAANALYRPVEVSRRNADSASIEILLSTKVGQIDGVVLDDRMQPLAGAQAVLVPDGANRPFSELYRNATTDQNGRFTLRGVVPGDYKVFVWDRVENFAYFDPDFLRRYEAAGKSMHIDESSRMNVEMKAIPLGD